MSSTKGEKLPQKMMQRILTNLEAESEDHALGLIEKSARNNLSLLHKAAEKELTRAVKRLIEKGVDVDARCESTQVTPLFMALRKNNKEIVKALLAAQADPNLRNELGETPLLFMSRINPDLGHLRLLLEAPIDVEATCDKGNTAFLNVFERARVPGYSDLIPFCRLLMDNGAKIPSKVRELRNSVLNGSNFTAGKNFFKYLDETESENANEAPMTTTTTRALSDKGDSTTSRQAIGKEEVVQLQLPVAAEVLASIETEDNDDEYYRNREPLPQQLQSSSHTIAENPTAVQATAGDGDDDDQDVAPVMFATEDNALYEEQATVSNVPDHPPQISAHPQLSTPAKANDGKNHSMIPSDSNHVHNNASSPINLSNKVDNNDNDDDDDDNNSVDELGGFDGSSSTSHHPKRRQVDDGEGAETQDEGGDDPTHAEDCASQTNHVVDHSGGKTSAGDLKVHGEETPRVVTHPAAQSATSSQLVCAVPQGQSLVSSLIDGFNEATMKDNEAAIKKREAAMKRRDTLERAETEAKKLKESIAAKEAQLQHDREQLEQLQNMINSNRNGA